MLFSSVINNLKGPVKTMGLFGLIYGGLVFAPKVSEGIQNILPNMNIGKEYITDDISNFITYGSLVISARIVDIGLERLVRLVDFKKRKKKTPNKERYGPEDGEGGDYG